MTVSIVINKSDGMIDNTSMSYLAFSLSNKGHIEGTNT